MRELSVRNLPITHQRMLTTEVRARYAEEGFTDKIALLDTRPRLYSQLYTLDDTAGYFYGSLAPSTGYVTLFDIEPYYNGFYLALPLRTSPDTLHRNVHQEKMFGIFPHVVLDRSHKLLRGFDEQFMAPHSRHTTILVSDAAKIHDLNILATSQEAGLYLAASRDGRRVFVTGHSAKHLADE